MFRTGLQLPIYNEFFRVTDDLRVVHDSDNLYYMSPDSFVRLVKTLLKNNQIKKYSYDNIGKGISADLNKLNSGILKFDRNFILKYRLNFPSNGLIYFIIELFLKQKASEKEIDNFYKFATKHYKHLRYELKRELTNYDLFRGEHTYYKQVSLQDVLENNYNFHIKNFIIYNMNEFKTSL